MSDVKLDNIVMENARILWPNFSGKKTVYNAAGNRNFCVKIENPDIAKDLNDLGWNIKTLKPLEEEDDPAFYLQVAVNFENIPPKIILVSDKKQNVLGEDSINILDDVRIKSADLVIRPYHWEVNGKEGIKAYLKTMYVTIEDDDPFASKYSDNDIYDDDIDDEQFRKWYRETHEEKPLNRGKKLTEKEHFE